MRTSIVWLLATGCGVFGGPGIEGDWSGDCEVEDQYDQNFDYEMTLSFTKLEKDRAEGEGDFDAQLDYDLSGESDDLEANRSDDRWEIEGEFEIDQGENSMDFELTADVDGDDMTGDVIFDWGGFEETGDCTFNRD